MYKLGEEYNKLRDYQMDCVTNVFDAFNGGSSSAAAILPMSAGKTVIVGAIVHNYLKNSPMRKALMLSHLDILTKQNEESLRKFWSLNTGILQAQSIPTRNKNCIVSTMQSFSDKDKVDRWGGLQDIGICVVDETHLYGNNSYDKIVANLPDDCLILGVTATPFRDNKDMTNMFDTVAYTISMQELIDRKQLVPPRLSYIEIPDEKDSVAIHKTILNIYYNKHNGEKTIIFLKTIQECEDLAKLANGVGLKAKAITSKLVGKARDEAIEAFKAGADDSADILVTVNVLTAGFSSDNVRSIFMPYKVNSVAAYLQRIGRGMRLDEGKDHVDIYVGGDSPELLQGYYEKMQSAALNAGSAQREETEFDIDDLPDGVTRIDPIEWTAETKKLKKELEKTGSDGLADLITRTDFPTELLDTLVKMKKGKNSRLEEATVPRVEQDFLQRHGVDPRNMNALDVTYAVTAVLDKLGMDKKSLYVQVGRLAGKPYRSITPMQKKFIPPHDRNSFYRGETSNKILYNALHTL